jgi:iron complex transport system permease protein
MNRITILTGLSLLLIAFCAIWTLTSGSTPLEQVWNGAIERLSGSSQQWNPLLDERLPRLIVLLCTGAAWAVSGAVMQALFHNPLATQSALGITFGGSLLVLLVFFLDWHLHYPWSVPLAAVAGCLSALVIVYSICRAHGHIQVYDLLLTGLAISTLLVAVQRAFLYALRDDWHLIQTVVEWEAGSTFDRHWRHVHMQLPLTLIGLWGCLAYRQEINILCLGDEEAKNLGVDVRKVRWRLFLCVSLLTGGAIAAAGIIAFFGMMLPHFVRLLIGPDNRRLIPLCILTGAAALGSLDVALRGFELYSLSIGNLSAVIGGLFFIALLYEQRRYPLARESL